ncbi:MAG: phenylalanine--tRNA ligase subunit beta [Bacteroidetes bacterium RIFOXYA12_FULL_35_11]|nr:MAG: phenylalanine--tRNA ligase subunit beta [Bacteroidetes bacterium GWF2_35_48]OFY74451.1 MAG: phenylalanine--tRNA ligase subunit beta [Bacteroidetes bacterium RIFOXYA12_FULL_35_11]OFY95731.1 MAG: phenylalanine--tRNA ligase subunit beta [Bacteroidetes bacterium RIFOXYC12_FULL_35_7]HBX52184.1 phenylalanine--tRNA ligase subunit beta [Bacteroidales bacterium]
MKISYNWLKEYININIAPEELAEILTSIGLEVGAVDTFETVKGGLQGIVIGEVVTKDKHPNADKLSVTTVNIGSLDLLKIVCGAPNVEAGQKVPVATIGTTIYKGEESFIIKESKIRGELSQGMICAEDEIGLGTSHDGIMVLPADAVIGTSARDYFNVTTDTVFEVDITPNRIEAASHIGVARDLAAFLKQNYVKPDVSAFKSDNNSNYIAVEVENLEACPRYSGITISGVAICESPDWLKNRLLSIGQHPINNVVDITNFILHEFGQPLHAFDADKIKGGKVVVKTLPVNTPFVTLDNIERKLHGQDLMICNAEEGMCIGGVYGGVHSGVSNDTKNIFLESAYFNPVYIRKTAKRQGLSTDASFLFERGVDPNETVFILKRAAMLIKEIAGGQIISDLIDVYPAPVEKKKVLLPFEKVDKLIGKQIGNDTIKDILKRLEINIVKETEKELELEIPTFKVDVYREADVIEEILRIYGYNNVEVPSVLNASLSYQQQPDFEKITNMIADYLSANGFNEIMCNSLSKFEYYDNNALFSQEKLVQILNPLSNELNVMRQSLLYGALESVVYNLNRKNQNLRLYEFGNCYQIKNKDGKSVPEKYFEDFHLSLVFTGLQSEPNWVSPAKPVSFFIMKSYVENILTRLGVYTEKLEKSISALDIFSDGLVYKTSGKELLYMGSVHRKTLKKFDIQQEVFYADINWTVLFGMLKNNKVKYAEIPKYPEVKRDLALLLDKQISFEQIKTLAQKTEKHLLKEVNLFDVYEGKNLGENKKSYAVSFILQDERKTLTDKQIDTVIQSLVKAFEKEFGAKLR